MSGGVARYARRNARLKEERSPNPTPYAMWLIVLVHVSRGQDVSTR
jgi:hypothetical protein